MTKRSPTAILMFVLLPLLLAIPAAGAPAGPVAPGGRLVLDDPDDDGTSCEWGEVLTDVPEWLCTLQLTFTNLDEKKVQAWAKALGLVTGYPVYHKAWLTQDFTVDGPPDDIVRARVYVKYDYIAVIAGASWFNAMSSLVVKVKDVDTGDLVGVHQLKEFALNNDQGLTDVSGAGLTRTDKGEVAAFELVLRRGHQYEMKFEAESYLQAGAGSVRTTAWWKKIVVVIDEDEVDLLDQHSNQLAKHDEDIKALLKELREGQLEIMRLLLTPQGQRSSDLVGDFPLKPDKKK